MNYFIHLSESGRTIIYNKITNPDTGNCCYPDILFNHIFSEENIADKALYEIAYNAISEYGSSRILIATYSSQEDRLFLESAMESIHREHNNSSFNQELYESMCDNLMLSASMRHSFYQLMLYYTETGGDMENLLLPFTKEYPLPVSNKNEGKKIYEIIRNSVLG